MDRYQERDSGGTNTVLIVLGIVGGVILLVALVCGGIAFLVFRSVGSAAQKFGEVIEAEQKKMEEVAQAQRIVTDFIEDLAAGRLDAAYADTTDRFQARMTKDQLSALVDKHSLIKKHTSVFANADLPAAAGRANFHVTISGAAGTMNCSVEVVKENERWKVDKFTVP
jgi:hypothetical protein